MRDRALGSTVRLMFNTTNPDGGGAPVAPSSAFAASDIRIYKDGSATEKTSTNGITVTSPFDSIVGLHLVEIDTSNSTGDAGFWASGSVYQVRLVTAKTVATYSVSGLPIGEFSLEVQTAATGVDELITLQNQILDAVNTYISNVTAAAILTPGTIVGFPETLTVGDSYTDDCDSAIQVFIRDENDDPITAVGTHDFTDGDFAPECIITQNGNTGRVNCTVTYVTASPENYLKIQIPSKESRRATPGIATVQVLLKWDGAQKALSKQTVTWEALI